MRLAAFIRGMFGARMLTFYPTNNHCVCCAASSEIGISPDLDAQIYEFLGNYTHLPTPKQDPLDEIIL